MIKPLERAASTCKVTLENAFLVLHYKKKERNRERNEQRKKMMEGQKVGKTEKKRETKRESVIPGGG